MPRSLRKTRSPEPQTPQESPPAPVRVALTPDNLRAAFLGLLASGVEVAELSALFAATAWCHGLMSAMVAAAPLPPAEYARIASASRAAWMEGMQGGLEAVERTRAKRTAARNRINRVFHLGPECDAWVRDYEAADLCDDALSLLIPQARCRLIEDLSHDKAEAA